MTGLLSASLRQKQTCGLAMPALCQYSSTPKTKSDQATRSVASS